MKKWIVLIFVVLILLCGKFYIDYSNKQAAESLLLNNYDEAVSLYELFYVSNLPLDEENAVVIDGVDYYAVCAFTTAADFETYLLRLFDNETVANLMANDVYVEVDNVLYGKPFENATNPHRGEETRSVVHKGDDDFVHVEVEILGEDLETVVDTAVYDFKYDENGRGVFVDYEPVR